MNPAATLGVTRMHALNNRPLVGFDPVTIGGLLGLVRHR